VSGTTTPTTSVPSPVGLGCTIVATGVGIGEDTDGPEPTQALTETAMHAQKTASADVRAAAVRRPRMLL
jgi:hypothetical protein